MEPDWRRQNPCCRESTGPSAASPQLSGCLLTVPSSSTAALRQWHHCAIKLCVSLHSCVPLHLPLHLTLFPLTLAQLHAIDALFLPPNPPVSLLRLSTSVFYSKSRDSIHKLSVVGMDASRVPVRRWWGQASPEQLETLIHMNVLEMNPCAALKHLWGL